MNMKGNCLCGNVTIEVEVNNAIEVCHCSMCRRWGSGPLMAVHSQSKPNIKGQDSIMVYQSSDWAERAFCKQCGTHLYYHLLGSEEYALLAGLFQEENNFVLSSQIFIDNKPAYYEFVNDTPTFTEQQLFDKFANSRNEP